MKKLLSLSLALVLLCCLTVPAVATGAEFSDMPEDYSTSALQAAVKNGLLKGAEGKIMPNDYLTRAQMAAVINRAFGATDTASISSYTDVAPTAWYYSDMAKAVQMKTFNGSGSRLNPEDPITRQEAFTVLARALKLPDAPASTLTSFVDASSVSNWAVGTVAAMVSKGFVHGADKHINPTANITRKDFAVLMDNVFKMYVTSPGTVTSVEAGNVMINTPGVTLKGVTILGDLVIGDGVGAGDVILDGVKVTGNTIVRGGGVNSIKVMGASSLGNVHVSKVNGNVRVYVENTARVKVVSIDDGKNDVLVEGSITKLEVKTATPVVVQNATVSEVSITAPSAEVTLGTGAKVDSVKASTEAAAATIEVTKDAKVSVLETAAPKTAVKLTDTATVDTLTATKDAAGTKVDTAKGTTVKTVNAAAPDSTVSGAGTVTTANISANNVNIGTTGTTAKVDKGVTGTIVDSKPVSGGTTHTPTKPEEQKPNNNKTTPSTPNVPSITASPVTLYAAKLHDTAELVDDEDIATNYSVTAEKWTSKNYVDVAIAATDLQMHKNGEGTLGYWVGFALEAPATATKFKVASGYSQGVISELSTAHPLEENINSAGASGVAIYLNCGDISIKPWWTVQWLTDSDTIVSTTTYCVNYSAVKLKTYIPYTPTVGEAYLHDAGGNYADADLITDYVVTKGPTVGNTTEVYISGTGVKFHENGEGNMGSWVGYSIPAPEGATRYKYAVSPTVPEATTDVSAGLDFNIDGQGTSGVAMYIDCGNPALTDSYLALQWFKGSAPMCDMLVFHVSADTLRDVGKYSPVTLSNQESAMQFSVASVHQGVDFTYQFDLKGIEVPVKALPSLDYSAPTTLMKLDDKVYTHVRVENFFPAAGSYTVIQENPALQYYTYDNDDSNIIKEAEDRYVKSRSDYEITDDLSFDFAIIEDTEVVFMVMENGSTAAPIRYVFRADFELDSNYVITADITSDTTLLRDYTVKSGKTLEIAAGTTLVIADGVTLTVDDGAAIKVLGTLVNKGTLICEDEDMLGTGTFENLEGTWYSSADAVDYMELLDFSTVAKGNVIDGSEDVALYQFLKVNYARKQAFNSLCKMEITLKPHNVSSSDGYVIFREQGGLGVQPAGYYYWSYRDARSVITSDTHCPTAEELLPVERSNSYNVDADTVVTVIITGDDAQNGVFFVSRDLLVSDVDALNALYSLE